MDSGTLRVCKAPPSLPFEEDSVFAIELEDDDAI